MRRFLLAAAFVAASSSFIGSARADVSLPAIFSDHMVIQFGIDAPIWGWADPNESVQVEMSGPMAGGGIGFQADAQGNWRANLPKIEGNGPFKLTVKGAKNTITINDVLVGEVWLCSGQSNMAMTVNRALNFAEERQAADLPRLRMFIEKSAANNERQTRGSGSWVVCSPETVGGFSATAFFFGREIRKARDVPVGLINSSVGGTPIESWIDAEAQRKHPKLKEFFEAQRTAEAEFDAEAALKNYEKQLAKWKDAAVAAKAAKQTPPRAPQNPVEVRKRKGNVGGLFNGKIAPLAGYGIRGALWYQGEANSTPEKAPYYQYQLALLVEDWRKQWGQGDFPFAWVQLPNYAGDRPGWPVVREAMLKTLRLPNTGMAVTVDIGEPNDIHPRNKQDVGRRLALWARATVYDEDIEYSGPLPDTTKIESDTLVVGFTHAEGLQARDGKLRGFEIAGANKVWHPAEAQISGKAVILSSEKVPDPVAVRYAWKDNPDCNLFNVAGLPASPFRTAEW